MLTTQFFALKVQRYRELHGISTQALAAVAEKAFANGALNENAWRREPLSRQAILDSAMVNYPLTQYMFCSPGEGAVALVLARGDLAHRYPAAPVFIEAAVMRTRRYGSFEVFSPCLSPQSVPARQPRPLPPPSRPPVWGRATSTWRRCRTPSRVPRSCTWQRPGSASTASRNT